MPNIQELVDKRVTLIAEVRKDWDLTEERCKKENRSTNEAENAKFTAGMDEADVLQKQITVLQEDETRSQRLAVAEANLEESRGRVTEPDRPSNMAQRHNPGQREQAAQQPEGIELRSFPGQKRTVVPSGPRDTPEYRAAFRNALHSPPDMRALQVDSGAAGGYLAPEQFMMELIRDLDNLVHMRRICRVLPPLTVGTSLGVPALDNAPADPTWTSEILTGDADTTMTLGHRALAPSPAAQSIRISKTLLRQAALNPEMIVREELAKRMAIVHENGFMNGTGANEPLGIFTASDNGITTSQDVSTGNTDTAITFDGLTNCKMDMPAQWRERGTWIFHREAILQLMKIKDGDGRRLWQPSQLASEPNRLDGHPVIESEYVPHAFTASLYVGVFGDFDRYWIIDSLAMSLQVVLELYALTNQNGYISRAESDGMPVSSAAFRRVKLAA